MACSYANPVVSVFSGVCGTRLVVVCLQSGTSPMFPGLLTTLEYMPLRTDPSTIMIAYGGNLIKTPGAFCPLNEPVPLSLSFIALLRFCDFIEGAPAGTCIPNGCALTEFISLNLVDNNGSFIPTNTSTPYAPRNDVQLDCACSNTPIAAAMCVRSCLLRACLCCAPAAFAVSVPVGPTLSSFAWNKLHAASCSCSCLCCCCCCCCHMPSHSSVK